MKVHHLNCGTMHPVKGPECVCHVLLLETDNGPRRRRLRHRRLRRPKGPGRAGPVHHPAGIRSRRVVANQLDRLGFQRSDVRHIVLTHLDTDHVGGAADFPNATDPRHLGRGRRGVRRAHPRGEGQVRPTTVGERPRRRRTRSPGRSVARVSQQPRNSSTSHPASCSSRYPATPAVMPASRSTQAIAGCCIAATPSTTTAPWTAPMCRAHCGRWKPLLPSTERRCGTTTLGCRSCTPRRSRTSASRPRTT